jgi:hypothetical protein
MAIVIASYYVLFAVMGGSGYVLIIESILMTAFVLVAVIGFKLDRWLVVACLGAHGLFDVLHDLIVANPGVPEWWPGFCLTFDIGAAIFLACLELEGRARNCAANPEAPRCDRASRTAT